MFKSSFFAFNAAIINCRFGLEWISFFNCDCTVSVVHNWNENCEEKITEDYVVENHVDELECILLWIKGVFILKAGKHRKDKQIEYGCTKSWVLEIITSIQGHCAHCHSEYHDKENYDEAHCNCKGFTYWVEEESYPTERPSQQCKYVYENGD